MALGAIAETIARIVVGLVVDHVVAPLFYVVFVMLYWCGWVVLRTVTLGRYPPSQAVPHNREFVAVVALATVLTGVTLYYWGSPA